MKEVRIYENGRFFWEPAPLADECRVTIVVDAQPLASVMASPFQLDALALGFLFGESRIQRASDVKSLVVDGLTVYIELNEARCGPRDFTLENIEDGATVPPPLSHPTLSAADILRLSEDFNAQSYLFRQTGAVHSCALTLGPRRYLADDVARHNALDKVIGQYLREGFPQAPAGALFTTGRISTEILIKSAKAGIGAVISRSAATDRAVDLAKRLNMIMIGFSRPNRFNIYHGEQFIIRK